MTCLRGGRRSVVLSALEDLLQHRQQVGLQAIAPSTVAVTVKAVLRIGRAPMQYSMRTRVLPLPVSAARIVSPPAEGGGCWVRSGRDRHQMNAALT